MLAEKFKVRLRIAAPLAGLTFDERVGAVQFDKTCRARPGKRVETINVLGHDRSELVRFLEADDRAMDVVRLRISERVPILELVIPVLDPRGFGSHEVVVVNRLAFRPDAIRAAKVGNTAAGRNSCAGKDERAARRTQVIGQLTHLTASCRSEHR